MSKARIRRSDLRRAVRYLRRTKPVQDRRWPAEEWDAALVATAPPRRRAVVERWAAEQARVRADPPPSYEPHREHVLPVAGCTWCESQSRRLERDWALVQRS